MDDETVRVPDSLRQQDSAEWLRDTRASLWLTWRWYHTIPAEMITNLVMFFLNVNGILGPSRITKLVNAVLEHWR